VPFGELRGGKKLGVGTWWRIILAGCVCVELLTGLLVCCVPCAMVECIKSLIDLDHVE
jgi:hypothetical protein